MQFGIDSPPEVLAMVRAIMLDPVRLERDWPEFCADNDTAAQRFDALTGSMTDEQASVAAFDYMSAKDMLAHLTIVNFAIASRLDALRTGVETLHEAPELFPGAQGKSLAELRAQHITSAQHLAQAAQQPIESEATAIHPLFGPLTAKQWIAIPAQHYSYHARQIKEIQGSEAYPRTE